MNSNSSCQIQTSLAVESDVNRIYIIVFSTIGGLIIIATFLFLKKRFSKRIHTTDQPLSPEFSPHEMLSIQTSGNIQTYESLESKITIPNNKVDKEENNKNFVISRIEEENQTFLGVTGKKNQNVILSVTPNKESTQKLDVASAIYKNENQTEQMKLKDEFDLNYLNKNADENEKNQEDDKIFLPLAANFLKSAQKQKVDLIKNSAPIFQ